jgi:hypothetical protein
MTEVLIVLATSVAALLLVDPFFGGGLVNSPFAKGVVLVLCVGTLSFHLLGRAITSPERLGKAVRDMVAQWWPLLLLSCFIFAGSAYAILAANIKESFLGMGLGMLFLPLMGLAVASSDNPMRLVKGLAAVHVLMVLTMFGFLIATDKVFHERMFLAVPLGVYFLMARERRIWQWPLGLALVAVCALSVKNTTFLMILATLAACGLVWITRVVRRYERLTALLMLYVGIVSMIAIFAGLFYAWLEYKSELPSGNTIYRFEMYGIAWQRFLDSPVWGTLFAEATVNYFTVFRVAQGTQNLPTHSDILDIMAHGGMIGLLLWGMVVLRMLSIVWLTVRRLTEANSERDLRPWRWLFVLGLVQVTAVITYAVNPPLINPVVGFWIWGGIGVMWALYRHLESVAPVVQPVRPYPIGKIVWA